MKKILKCVVLFAAMPAGVTASPDNVDALHELFAQEWEFRMQEFPLFATYVGVHAYNDRLQDAGRTDQLRRAAEWERFLQALERIERASLPLEEQVNYALFQRQLRNMIRDIEFGAWQIPLNSDSGFHTAFARMPVQVPLHDLRDYQNYVARLEAWPRHVDQQIANMRIGLERGMTLPRAVLTGIESTIEAHIVRSPEESVFYAPFSNMPAHISDPDKSILKADGRKAIMQSVVRGYAKFLRFMLEEYIPRARETLGASALPLGEAYYAQQIVRYTTRDDLSGADIHRIGQREVARIRAEMDAIIARLRFEGGFAEFLEFLRTDPRFYADSPDALLREAAYIAKTMDGKLPGLFGMLPRLPYGVAPVPEHMAPKYTAGRYVPPSLGSGQPGWYWVNTYKLESRPLYALPALTLHEAVPGHHLQFALALEQGEQPPFRRFDYISAFGEGWGLYAEWLGVEAGIYSDPYADFGRLTYEMWRACRLVVDTGLHLMGWTRQQAIEYLAGNTALSLHEVATEVDRYISWPGQALSYKIGELKIRELRARAESALGPAFDIRGFHDAVLVNGSVTLPLLEEAVERFIAARAQEK